MSQQYDTAAKNVNAVVESINKYSFQIMAYSSSSLFSFDLTPPDDKYYIQFWEPYHRKNFEQVQKKARRTIGESMFLFVKRDLKRDMRILFKYWNRYHTKMPNLFLIRYWESRF